MADVIEFEVGGRNYRTPRLSAMDQLHVSRRIAPVLAELAPALGSLSRLLGPVEGEEAEPVAIPEGGELGETLPPLMKAFAAMSDADVDYVINKCFRALQVDAGGDKWARMMSVNGAMMDDTMQLPDMLQILYKVVEANLASFFHTARPNSPGNVTP